MSPQLVRVAADGASLEHDLRHDVLDPSRKLSRPSVVWQRTRSADDTVETDFGKHLGQCAHGASSSEDRGRIVSTLTPNTAASFESKRSPA
jgi:hypothetical protein